MGMNPKLLRDLTKHDPRMAAAVEAGLGPKRPSEVRTGGTHKYHAKPVEIDGIKFPSTKEGDYYNQLKLEQRAGLILCFLRQVPFHLPGGVVYRLDFMVFSHPFNDVNGVYRVRFIDVKGVKTPVYEIKRKQVEELYGIHIEEV
jgi:hypothetical protein